jgi:hypothetical protein
MLLLVTLALAPTGARAQQSLAHAPPDRFISWRPPVTLDQRPATSQEGSIARNRGRHALIGGAIGAAAAIVACTAISTLANDDGDGGISTCPLDTYLIMGGAGFALGFAVGWVV